MCTSIPKYTSNDWGKFDNTILPGYKWREFKAKDKIGTILIFDPIFIPKEGLYPSLDPEYIPSDKTHLYPYTIYREINIENHKGGNLIPYLNSNGYNVVLVSPENPLSFSLKKAGIDMVKAVELLDKETNIILGGVSLGGQSIAYYLSSGNVSHKIKKVFFLGTGLDYKYTGSLQTQIEKITKKEESIPCKISQKDNICNRYVTSLYIDDGKSRRAVSYPSFIPNIEKNPNQFSGITNLDLELLLIYGKLDGISPEESVLAPYFRGWGSNLKIRYLEASTSSNFNHDYDHYDLFFHEDAPGEIYRVIANWTKRK